MTDSYQYLKQINNGLDIKHVHSKEFENYGRIIDAIDVSEWITYVNEDTHIPKEGNIYEASIQALNDMSCSKDVKREVFGEMNIQVGICNGNSFQLNALEYHKSPEVNVAITDMILFLGHQKDIKDGQYDSDQTEIFFVPKGVMIEVNPGVLHFAPCKVNSKGFKCVVVLEDGTNHDLEIDRNRDDLLFKKNKWLITHPENERMVNNKAAIGIVGDNYAVNYIEEEKHD